MKLDAQLDPVDVLDAGRFLAYEQSVKRSRLIDRALRLIDRPDMTVCDVGGASGVFVDQVIRQAKVPVKGTVVDVLEEYRGRMVDPALEFLRLSIVDDEVPEAAFDIVTARHMLHHLVGGTLEQTRALQRRALAAMLRMVKPGGHVLIEEQVNRIEPFSRAVYYLSRFASRHQLRIRYFETGKVVVSFMTPRELASDLAALVDRRAAEIVEYAYEPRKPDLRWKLTVLMADVGNDLYVLRRPS